MLRSDYPPVVAIDLGGTKIMAAVVAPGGKIISHHYCSTLADRGPEKVINRLLSAVQRVISQSAAEVNEFGGISIAAAGAMDIKKGIITASPNLPGWRNVPLRDILGNEFGITTYLINDASAAALGEYYLGVGRGMSNLVYLTVSTGVGGGIIIDGRLYIGANGSAGEIGHMTIAADGPQCSCGNYGCLEVLASGTAVAKEAVRRVELGEKSSLIEIANGKIKSITAETVSLAAKQGDYLAGEIVNDAAYYLGIGIANVINIFNPEMVIIGGGMSKMGDMLLKPARRVAKQRAFQLPARTARIVRARLGGNAGIVGAAAYVLDHQQKA